MLNDEIVMLGEAPRSSQQPIEWNLVRANGYQDHRLETTFPA
jgi:hypothetical protein